MVPAFVGIALHSYTEYDKIVKFSFVIGILCIVQTVFWFIAVFTTRVSEQRSTIYVSCMPEFTYYASFFALGVMPVVISTITLMALYLVEHTAIIAPFGVFSLFCEIAVLVAYILDFRKPLIDDLELWQEERAAY